MTSLSVSESLSCQEEEVPLAVSSCHPSFHVKLGSEEGGDQKKESMLLGKKIFTFLKDLQTHPLQIFVNEV